MVGNVEAELVSCEGSLGFWVCQASLDELQDGLRCRSCYSVQLLCLFVHGFSFRYFTKDSSSCKVASFLRKLALLDMTATLPLVYPSLGFILSREGDVGLPRFPCFNLIPKTGQTSGTFMSLISKLKGRENFLALCLAHANR